MGSDAISALYDSLTAEAKRSGVASILQYFQPVRTTVQNAYLSSVASSLRGLYHNDKVNWGQVVFLTTCLIAMTGCGLLSSLMTRKLSWSKGSRAQRLAACKSLTKSSKSLSSSEDEDYEDEEYDSNASLRHGTNPNYKVKDTQLEPRQQSSDGR